MSLVNRVRLSLGSKLVRTAAVVLVVVAGCGGEEGTIPGSASGGGAPGSTAALSGKVVVDGSSTVFRISKAAQIAFAKEENSKIKVNVGNHGTGGGFGRYLEGEVDIVDASRKAKPEEESRAKAAGFEWTRFLVGYDGITVAVNPKNSFVKSITVEQLARLFEPGSKIETWKDVDPSWPDRKLVLYSPDNDSGTYEFFCEAVLKQPGHRQDLQASPDDNMLVKGIAGDIDGLGYFGYAYFVANKDKLRALPLQDGPDAKPVMPSLETILDKSYKPLSRPLYIYVKNSALERPEVKEFVSFYLTHNEALARKAGYVPPTTVDMQVNQAALGGK
jgi:phosphate transport system substrate-binding protein